MVYRDLWLAVLLWSLQYLSLELAYLFYIVYETDTKDDKIKKKFNHSIVSRFILEAFLRRHNDWFTKPLLK